MSDSKNIPDGWTVNASAWKQRLPIVGLALIGFGIALYLTLFQVNTISNVWEPFFGNGSRKILTSPVSNILPVPDAMLGALGYLLDAISGSIGGTKRWKTMPWIVIIFGIVVGPLGIISVLLVIFQPVLFNAWCTLCLASAAISIGIIGPAMDESLASLQYLKRVKQSGDSIWRAFWGLSHKLA